MPQPPRPGQIVHVRQRRWLVNSVVPGAVPSHATLVRLSCLEDDAAGEHAEVLWSVEVDARVLPDQPELMDGSRLDDPPMFGAYLHALRWHSVTSTDHRLLQAPFRAGIDLKPYQLEPLRKALELPRVNLFIADDVGLGKTIEAGLVLQELLLRQRVERVLVVAPPAVTLQWQEELEQRFGLSFAIYDRDFVTARRRERGFAVNPWTTHSRFIVSYTRLRGSRGRGGNQHLELLLSALDAYGSARTLLILDECHQVAPSHGSLYPADSQTTRAIREVCARFEHRLFLSATPHNGHSSSFSSLLHLLDPQRFTRGVPVASPRELAPVMVRRLKRHLRGSVPGLPKRTLVDHVVDAPDDCPEVALSRLLATYDGLYRRALAGLPPAEQQARALVVVNLHKRLLSSVDAFHRTLRSHAAGAERLLAGSVVAPPSDEELEELDDDQRDEAEAAFQERASVAAGAEAKALLDQMLALASRHAPMPDARAHALAAWLRENLCPDGRWLPTRVVVFTEYQHTLSWLRRVLPPLLKADCTGRIETYTGQHGAARREAIKAAFNTDPDEHPVRILLATDAAREGINLQAHCHHLFHFDLPWNPSRIEQRNGRIDRVLQPAPEVFCHYFVLPARPEDRVLAYLVEKLHRIRDELGSLSGVISDRLAEQLAGGIRDVDAATVDRLSAPDEQAVRASQQLEGDGAEQLRGDLEVLSRQYDRSRRSVDFRTEHLRALVDLGLRLVSEDGAGLTEVLPARSPARYTLPPLDSSWERVLAPMQGRPVSFTAAHRLDADSVQLHLGHPLVKRLVARFRAQGFAAHDLSRVTALVNPRDLSRRVVLFGRLSLFGHGATRLHEALLAVAARVTDTGLEPFADAGRDSTVEWLEEALAHAPKALSDEATRSRLRARAQRDATQLFELLAAEAKVAEQRAAEALAVRGDREAEAMVALLDRQRAALTEALAQHSGPQLALLETRADRNERAQFERDRRAMQARLDALDDERLREPEAIRAGYEVVLRRFEPVGLAYLWPEA